MSLAWLVIVQVVPAGERPYVGGTTDNSELSLSFGHNGFGRVLGEPQTPGHIVHVHPRLTHATRAAAAATPLARRASAPPLAHRAGAAPIAHRASGAVSSAGPPGLLRLFDAEVGDQGAWLLPFALIGLLALAITTRGRGRRDRRLALWLVLGGWFVAEAAC